ncbi:MAG: hypothetical protein V3T72_16135 [Thermoanaerobaculia bacterium]
MDEDLDTPTTCIRWYASTPGPCAVCGGAVGTGPAGFRTRPEPGPLCDTCLTRAEPGLGRLLLAVNAIRELSDDLPADPRTRRHRVLALTLLAKLFHRLESRHWPYRGRLLADLLDQTAAAGAGVPLETAVTLADDLIGEAIGKPRAR